LFSTDGAKEHLSVGLDLVLQLLVELNGPPLHHGQTDAAHPLVALPVAGVLRVSCKQVKQYVATSDLSA